MRLKSNRTARGTRAEDGGPSSRPVDSGVKPPHSIRVIVALVVLVAWMAAWGRLGATDEGVAVSATPAPAAPTGTPAPAPGGDGVPGDAGVHWPAAKSAAEIAALQKKIDAVLVNFGKPDPRWRAHAVGDLVNLGLPAVPLVARMLNGPDPEVSLLVRQGLEKMAGGVERGRRADIGIGGATEWRLTAALAGPRPAAGQAIPLWILLTNISDHEVHVRQWGWTLRLTAAPADQIDLSDSALPNEEELADIDDLVVQPGESAGYLMNAEPPPPGTVVTAAYLALPLSPSARQTRMTANQATHAGSREELISGPIEAAFAPPAQPFAPEAVKLWQTIQASDDAAGLQGVLAVKPEAWAAALTVGMESAEVGERWKAFEIACATSDPALVDPVIAFLGNLGPCNYNRQRLRDKLRPFSREVSDATHLVFPKRLAVAMLFDWHMGYVATDACYVTPDEAANRAAVTWIFLEYYDRGIRRWPVLNWLMWECYSSSNPKIKDLAKAQGYADEAAKQWPRSLEVHLIQALLKNDTKEVDRLFAQIKDPDDQNETAWRLVANFPRGSAMHPRALDLMNRCMKATPETDPEYAGRLDTKAACQAAVGDYFFAARSEDQSYALLKPDLPSRQGYAQRLAWYIALNKANPNELPQQILAEPRLRSSGPRNALLERLKTEKDAMLRGEIIKVLKVNYPRDPLVKPFLMAGK